MVRVFANGLRNLGSMPGQVIPKTQKNDTMVLNGSLFNTQHYKVQIKGKWSNQEKGMAPSLIPQYSSYWKGSLHVVLNYSQPIYLSLMHCETQVLPYFGYVRHNSTVLAAFAKVMKLTSHIGVWNAQLTKCYLQDLPLWLETWLNSMFSLSWVWY